MATQAPRGPLRKPHLRQASTGSLGSTGQASAADESEAETSVPKAEPSTVLAKQSFVLSVHDPQLSNDDVILNLSPSHDLRIGALLELAPARDSVPDPDFINCDVDPNKRLHFLFKPPSQDILFKQPNLQISVSQRIAAAFGFEHGNIVFVSAGNKLATHVEINFRDQHLTRADMWHLVAKELVGTCVYKGQKVEFLGTIRAHIKTVYLRGRKVQSAFFHHSTKPIFRSESARYVIFIQMSKEMWDFDAEGTGEIMFDRCINGLLPELFQKWRNLRVNHSLSIVLFTRMVYEEHRNQGLTEPSLAAEEGEQSRVDRGHSSKDFFRVVVSDMAGEAWADILNQLKREFKVFLKDVSIQEPGLIKGHPSSATLGNVLEAVQLASSQFSSDQDGDLIRTGLSIVVISPGAGLFEVDYGLLVATTDNLIENGVGIDLICLRRIPLHSVPLFKYRPPARPVDGPLEAKYSGEQDDKTPTESLASNVSPVTPTRPSVFDHPSGQKGSLQDFSRKGQWCYGVPQWMDTSFWAPSLNVRAMDKVKRRSSFDTPQHKTFVPRVTMYEIQMMGVMENAISNISIPQLPRTFLSETPNAMPTSARGSHNTQSKLSVSGSLSSRTNELYDHVHKLSTSVTSNRTVNQRVEPHYQWMDSYDDLVFRHPLVAKKRARKVKTMKRASSIRQQQRYSPSLLGTSAEERRSSHLRQGKAHLEGRSTGNPSNRPLATTTRRQFSFGPRGKAVASTEVTTRHEVGSLLSRGFKSGLLAKPAGLPSATPNKTPASQKFNKASFQALDPSSESDAAESKPIPIRSATAVRPEMHSKYSHTLEPGTPLQDRLTALQDLRQQEMSIPVTESDLGDEVRIPPIALSPSTTLAPWVTILNPSNPSKTTESVMASRFGRWQHVFPRPLKTSQIKWSSLCSPAPIPLTTEDFPSFEQLAEEYDEFTYVIDLPDTLELSETVLATEMLAFRLSRGFQFVLGPRAAEITKMPFKQMFNVFDEELLTNTSSSIFLLRGSTIHQLSRSEANKIEVKQFFRRGREPIHSYESGSVLYRPLIRSMLADKYEAREVPIALHLDKFDWKMIDSAIVGQESPQTVDILRPWRARFVLIPVEAPSSARRRMRSDEDDEEEIRLEGLRKLTQVWQRFRYVPPNERRYHRNRKDIKDANPLDIMYQTKNPSAIVAAELENVAEGDTSAQLLPESDLFQRSNYKIAALAETIQSEKGVRMLDRRWHLRLHYNCFIGFEFTSWLLQNFRDVDTRDEAVDLGNELMVSGLFKHVEQRHNFRDGNYFYQVAEEYRTPRPESKGWFGRGKASVPSTPMTEGLPITGRSRSSSNSNSTENNDPTTPAATKKHLGVALSKALIYDVDHRKRSYRLELINLHYDRVHNPDNCYHIRVEWMNTTPKLIQDAVISWATSVDRFGLRLVELPLAEASSITSMHPFRATHLVKLAQPPPMKQPQGYFDSTSLSLQPRTEKNFYQKAIMKRFNFVLDFEAASDFPADVDVTYSWGKPDYRYPQYVHRSGMLIAQITDEGDFLLLANWLYNNRNAAPLSHKDQTRMDHTSDTDQARGPGFFRSSPHRGTHPPYRLSPLHTPYASPYIHATLNLSHHTSTPQHEPQDPPPTSTPAFPKHIDPTRPSATAASTPDATKKDLEAFCNNADALTLFYEEVLSKASTPGPNTPFMGGKTPSKASETGGEGGIPTLALPGRLVDRVGEVGRKADGRGKSVSGGSPRVLGQKGE